LVVRDGRVGVVVLSSAGFELYEFASQQPGFHTDFILPQK